MTYLCDTCGKDTDEITQHHVLPRGLGGQDLKTNIVHICIDCHNLIHNRINGYSSNLIKVGLKKLADSGRKLGPPVKINDEIKAACIEMKKTGMSYDAISVQVGLSVGSVYKMVKQGIDSRF